ncbi:hypothetical protein J8273_5704 [Carpediemonas membranifera]|uniref:Uncharacterized protein n=1 Tax=Carpediemonas membranifera TaxID=201153 RepID=A0A8J6B9R0_9EUKA|nr:hypothetical protein J8273_5704 [Carpediemonas membranifera]|eukprot:KAG9392892.1 hypothetical protein J8273_5704 [Carpediemonas membranifera]
MSADYSYGTNSNAGKLDYSSGIQDTNHLQYSQQQQPPSYPTREPLIQPPQYATQPMGTYSAVGMPVVASTSGFLWATFANRANRVIAMITSALFILSCIAGLLWSFIFLFAYVQVMFVGLFFAVPFFFTGLIELITELATVFIARKDKTSRVLAPASLGLGLFQLTGSFVYTVAMAWLLIFLYFVWFFAYIATHTY